MPSGEKHPSHSNRELLELAWSLVVQYRMIILRAEAEQRPELCPHCRRARKILEEVEQHKHQP